MKNFRGTDLNFIASFPEESDIPPFFWFSDSSKYKAAQSSYGTWLKEDNSNALAPYLGSEISLRQQSFKHLFPPTKKMPSAQETGWTQDLLDKGSGSHEYVGKDT